MGFNDHALALWRLMSYSIVVFFMGKLFSGADLEAELLSPRRQDPFVVKLERLPELSPGSSNLTGRSVYVGRIGVGNPRSTDVIVSFATALGDTVLTSSQCRSKVCLDRQGVSPSRSAMSVMLTDKGAVEVLPIGGTPEPGSHSYTSKLQASWWDPETGNFTGECLYETLCLGEVGGGKPCAALGVMLAADMPNMPFINAPFDGIVGLGLQGLSSMPLFSFLGRLFHESSALKHEFGVFLGEYGGEIVFGGHSPERLASSEISWVPVVRPEQGFWQVGIHAIRVGNHTLVSCRKGGCRGILDSTIPDLQTPFFLAHELMNTFSLLSGSTSGRACVGPDLHFDLANRTTLTLRSKYYVNQHCRPRVSVLPVEHLFTDVIVLGVPFLRQYYTIFDVAEKRLGFGIAASQEGTAFEMRAPAYGKRNEAEQLEVAWKQEQDALNGVDPLNLLMFQGLVQYCGLALLVLIVAQRQKWSKRLQHVRRSVQFDVSDIPLVPPHEVPEGDDCVICLGCCEEGRSGNLTDLECWRRLPCGHKFHEGCIFEWLRKADQCPVCRRKIGLERLTSYSR